jgi:predicted HicB family RNase H-like nuclease
MAQDEARAIRRGRPPIAAYVSQLPACTVPTDLHDAVVRQALRRQVSVAQVVREALIFHLKTRDVKPISAQ